MKKLAGNPYLKVDTNKIFIDSVPLNELIEKFETPFMILIENRIRDNINTFKEIFNSVFSEFQCFYSIKSNYLESVLKIISSEDTGAELISLPELNTTLKAGFNPNKIILGGPYLPNKLIKSSLENSIKEIIIYDLDDLKRVNKIADDLNQTQDICLRINSMKFESKLGVKINKTVVKKIKNLFSKYSNLNLTTLLSHYSTQMNSLNQFLENIKVLIKAKELLKRENLDIKNINIGGGFPESTVMPKKQLKKIAQGIKSYIKEKSIEIEKIYAEPGRYLVGDAGVFVTDVIKKSKNRWIFLNIGNHMCPKFANCSLRFYNASRIDTAHKFKTSIAGIIPTDQDILVKDYFFTDTITLNDKVLITNVGAYCLTFSNRFPYRLPNILMVKDKHYQEIFNPEKENDFSI